MGSFFRSVAQMEHKDEWRWPAGRQPDRSPRHECKGSSRMAMLTTGVNIAVFAAFHIVIRAVHRVDAAFKPVCGPYERDISCYGRQKRHDHGKKWQGCGNGR